VKVGWRQMGFCKMGDQYQESWNPGLDTYNGSLEKVLSLFKQCIIMPVLCTNFSKAQKAQQ